MTALIRKVALKKVDFIALIVQTIVYPVAVMLFYFPFLFMSGVCFCLVLNTHYMWFLEGQDLATEAVEPSLFSDGNSREG